MFANPRDSVGLSIKGLDQSNIPRSGDVIVYKKDTTSGQTRECDAQNQVLDIRTRSRPGIRRSASRDVVALLAILLR